MSSAVKTLENQAKHLTKAEIEARAAAEAGVTPDREADLKNPIRGVTGTAATYWRTIVQRLKDVDLLDDLDKETLGIYCQMLARRDRLNRVCERLAGKLAKLDTKQDDNLEDLEELYTDKLDSLCAKLATLERNIASYADRLGFSPQSRTRLAQKRAAAAADNQEDDLFGT